MNLDPGLADQRELKGPPCTVGRLLARLDAEEPEQADLLRLLLANPAVKLSALSRNLAANGEKVLPATLARHASRPPRARECRCP